MAAALLEQLAVGRASPLGGDDARGRGQPRGRAGDDRGRDRSRRRTAEAADRRRRPGLGRGDRDGCGDACPIYPGKRYEDWTVEDLAGKSVEEVRPIRDDRASCPVAPRRASRALRPDPDSPLAHPTSAGHQYRMPERHGRTAVHVENIRSFARSPANAQGRRPCRGELSSRSGPAVLAAHARAVRIVEDRHAIVLDLVVPVGAEAGHLVLDPEPTPMEEEGPRPWIDPVHGTPSAVERQAELRTADLLEVDDPQVVPVDRRRRERRRPDRSRTARSSGRTAAAGSPGGTGGARPEPRVKAGLSGPLGRLGVGERARA